MRDLRIRRHEVERLAFTKSFLKELRCQKGRDRQYIFDSKTPRLAICVTDTGSKSFYVVRRGVNGEPKRFRLGGFPELSIEQARKRAEETNSDIARGIDPHAVKRAKRGETTFKELFDYWIENHARARKKTWREDIEKFERHLKPFHNRKLSEITRGDVATLHVRLAKPRKHPDKAGWTKRQIGGPGTANRVLALTSAMFTKAVELGFQGPNPAKGIKKFPEKERERFLHADEMPRFFAALRDELSDSARDFFLLALYTGARRANVQAMRWEQLNIERGTWEVPDTKGGRPQTVYLPEPAREILKARKDGATSEWVFPGRGKSGHMEEPKSAWKRVLTRAGIQDLRVHDLRRTLGSWQAAGGTSLHVIGKSLGHRNQSTTAIYARLDLDPVKEAVDRATAAITAAAERG